LHYAGRRKEATAALEKALELIPELENATPCSAGSILPQWHPEQALEQVRKETHEGFRLAGLILAFSSPIMPWAARRNRMKAGRGASEVRQGRRMRPRRPSRAARACARLGLAEQRIYEEEWILPARSHVLQQNGI